MQALVLLFVIVSLVNSGGQNEFSKELSGTDMAAAAGDYIPLNRNEIVPADLNLDASGFKRIRDTAIAANGDTYWLIMLEDGYQILHLDSSLNLVGSTRLVDFGFGYAQEIVLNANDQLMIFVQGPTTTILLYDKNLQYLDSLVDTTGLWNFSSENSVLSGFNVQALGNREQLSTFVAAQFSAEGAILKRVAGGTLPEIKNFYRSQFLTATDADGDLLVVSAHFPMLLKDGEWLSYAHIFAGRHEKRVDVLQRAEELGWHVHAPFPRLTGILQGFTITGGHYYFLLSVKHPGSKTLVPEVVKTDENLQIVERYLSEFSSTDRTRFYPSAINISVVDQLPVVTYGSHVLNHQLIQFTVVANEE